MKASNQINLPKELALKEAMSRYLTDWPQNMSTEDVLANIGIDDNIVIWEPFEDKEPDDIVWHIESLASSFVEFTNKQIEAKDALIAELRAALEDSHACNPCDSVAQQKTYAATLKLLAKTEINEES